MRQRTRENELEQTVFFFVSDQGVQKGRRMKKTLESAVQKACVPRVVKSSADACTPWPGCVERPGEEGKGVAIGLRGFGTRLRRGLWRLLFLLTSVRQV